MENYINTLPINQVFLFLAVGALLHLVFYIISTYVIPVFRKKRNSIGLYWLRFQIISWTIFLLLFFSSLFKANMYLTLAITIIVIGIGWNFWTNFFAGIVIKFTNQFKVNDNITTDLAVGKIKAIKMTFTEVINTKGELLVIPNNEIKKTVLKHHSKKNTISTTSFNCTAPRSQNEIYDYAMNCPYFTGNQAIKITQNKDKVYEIKAMLVDVSFKEKAVKYFENLS